jgi:tRNA-intron lyase
LALKIIFDREKGEAFADEPEAVSSLARGFYGRQEGGRVYLSPEEALYVVDIRNGSCTDTALNPMKFNDLAQAFGGRKLMARYHTFKDWRDRGLVIRPVSEAKGKYGRNPVKRYPPGKFRPPRLSAQGLFFPEDLMAVIDDEQAGRELYQGSWFGQFGSYKAEQRGRVSKLDVYETLFMMRRCGLSLRNASQAKVVAAAKRKRPDFLSMYQVYDDWRMRGYVLKTGFKFGTHFRLYLPGASPARSQDEWIHSKHVVHVFPRTEKMLISEWARAIRVAHSVKKTFILAIPGRKAGKAGRQKLDFLLFHRKSGGIETPKGDSPRFLMLSLSEEEYIGGAELAQAIAEAKAVGLELILAIADRETSVTYYRVKRLEIPGSPYEYYEIEWEQP